jgi:hypothetical protein
MPVGVGVGNLTGSRPNAPTGTPHQTRDTNQKARVSLLSFVGKWQFILAIVSLNVLTGMFEKRSRDVRHLNR